jgi:predicted amidohydrolase YtcJ
MLVLYNAKVYTFDSSQPLASALAIQDNQIVAVGNDATILSLASLKDQKVDLSGQTIIPGMTDSHIHLLQYAQSLYKINCEVSTKTECLARIEERVGKLSDESWILGHGWNQNNWHGEYGTALELDNITENHPTYLTSKSLHASWVNTTAMHLADIDQNTSDPPGGKIRRDARGIPTGILFDNATLLIEKIIPQPTNSEASSFITNAIEQLHRFGFTAVHDFDDPVCYDALKHIQSQGNLNLRVTKNFPITKWQKPFEDLPKTGEGDNFLQIGALKLFADGALGSRTASMFSPYDDDANNLGILINDHNQLYDIGQKAVDHGISLAIHAIGDRANHEVILACQNIREYEDKHNLPHRRHRIEHVQLLLPEDIFRFKNLDLIASVQPIHATSDQHMARLAWGERTKYSYPLNTLFSRGIPVIFGSDAPVENPNPFHAIYSAVTRNLPGKKFGEAFHPEQTISLTQAFSAFCHSPAYAIGKEYKLGSIKPGYLADLVVLPDDPFASDLDSLYNMNVITTMVNGKWVWQA